MLIDLDDTIIDFSGGAEACWKSVCASAADRTPDLRADELFHQIIRTRDWYWSDPERHRQGRADLNAASNGIVEMSLRRLGFDLPLLATELGLLYRRKRNESIKLVPGAVEALEWFRDIGVGLELITNGSSESQRGKIERFGLERHFDHVFIEGEKGFGKPEPEVYLNAMAALGSSASNTWCVGDNLEWEVAAPQKLGIYSVWIDPTGKGTPAGSDVVPDLIVTSIAEIRF